MAINLKREGIALNAEERNKRNENLTIIEQELEKIGSASALAELAKLAADDAKVKTENVQQQVNALTVSGDSSPQAAQASIGADGTDYDGNLKARLDAEHNTVTAQLAEKASIVEVDSKLSQIGDAKPSGVYATLSALQTAFPTGDGKNIYLVTADGKWYYWNATAWTAGGVYQGIALSSGDKEKVDAVPVINEYLIGQKTAGELKKESLIATTDWELHNAVASIDAGRLKIVGTSGTYNAISKDVKKIRFTIGSAVGSSPFVLLGIGETFTCVGVHAGVQRRVFEVVEGGASSAYTQILPANTALTGAGAGDEVVVELSGNLVVVQVKRVGQTEFVELFTIDMSQYSGANGWKTAPKLGFATVATTNYVGEFVYRYNMLTLDLVGTHMTDAILNLHTRTTTLEQETGDIDLVNVTNRLDGHDQEIGGLQSQIDILNPSTNTGRWFGKTWNSLGDSFSSLNKYQPMVKGILGLTKVNNYGVGGSTIGKHPTLGYFQPMSERYATMTDTTDLITVWGGVNDYGNGAYGSQGGLAIGSITDTTNTTFKGALKILIEGLVTKYPTKKIAFITPIQMNEASSMQYKNGKKPNSLGHTLLDYSEAMKEVCAVYGIPCLDMYKTSGVNEKNIPTLTYDGLHPSDEGFAFLSHKIAKFIETL